MEIDLLSMAKGFIQRNFKRSIQGLFEQDNTIESNEGLSERILFSGSLDLVDSFHHIFSSLWAKQSDIPSSLLPGDIHGLYFSFPGSAEISP